MTVTGGWFNVCVLKGLSNLSPLFRSGLIITIMFGCARWKWNEGVRQTSCRPLDTYTIKGRPRVCRSQAKHYIRQTGATQYS